MVDRKLGLNHSDLGVVNALTKKVTYDQEDERLYMGTVPINSRILRISTIVGTAFDSGTNNHIEVGTLADQDAYAANIDVSGTGVDAGTVTAAAAKIAANTDVYVTYDGTGTAATEGECMVVVEYVVGD